MQRIAVLVMALVTALACCLPLGAFGSQSATAAEQVGVSVSAQLDELSAPQKQAIAAATDVMYAYITTFNSRDPARWADTLLFPHVRISSGGVTVHPTREAFVEQMDFAAFAQRINWQRSAWDRLEVIQASSDKVHFAVTFSRYDPQQKLIASFDSLYVLQPDDSGNWGIRARSSFAP